jgi:predicted thioredoxin/glutaredoxin
MKQVQVLGSGCKKCVKTAELIKAIADEQAIALEVTKESNPETMMKYGVMSTPAVVVDGQLVHSGSVPTRENVQAWLEAITGT